MPLKAKDLQELISQKLDEAHAIVGLAEQEDRELTADDETNITAIKDEVGEDGDNPTGLYARWRHQQKIEAFLNTPKPESRPLGGGRPADGHTKPDIAPVRHYRPSSLKAFRNEEDAHAVGQFVAATILKRPEASQWCQEHGIDTRFRAALGESDNASGGFLVPEQMEQAIINLREEYGVFRREARVMPMSSDHVTIPRRTSGVTAYYGDENPSSAMTDSDKAWDQVALTARKLYVLTKYSNELAADSIIDIGADLTQEIAYAFAYKEDLAGFTGDGTSTYGGITGVENAMSAGSIKDAATGNTAFSTLDLADFLTVIGALPQYATPNAKWFISRPGYWNSMARLAEALGGNTVSEAASGPNQRQFLGFPVVMSQVLNTTLDAQTDTSILAFGDLRLAATMGTRSGMSILVSEHAYFEYDQLAIRGTERYDINVHETGDASNAGALIVMQTPSA